MISTNDLICIEKDSLKNIIFNVSKLTFQYPLPLMLYISCMNKQNLFANF